MSICMCMSNKHLVGRKLAKGSELYVCIRRGYFRALSQVYKKECTHVKKGFVKSKPAARLLLDGC